jgi:hypothetical protein
VFLVNSRYPLVCATLLSSSRKGFHQKGSSFFRSYGGNLPSSLTIVLPIALVFSTRPPVSVWGTGSVPAHCWAFLGSMGSVTSPEAARHHVSGLNDPNSHWDPPTRLPGDNQRPGSSTLLRPPPAIRQPLGGIVVRQPPRRNSWTWREHGGTGISTSCASATPCGLALAPDSPWED